MKFQLNITGGAYFKVELTEGVFAYTLGRQFELDINGIIITEQGYKLINAITVPQPFGEPLRIDEHGVVSVLHDGTWISLGSVIVIGFEHPELLDDLGDGYYQENIGSGDPVIGTAGEPPFEGVVIYYFSEAGSKERQIAVLNIKKLGRINDFIAKMHGISLNMSLHTDLYPSPMPSLVTFDANIAALEAAEAVTATRMRGSVQLRNQAYDLLLDNVHGLLNYVQNLADNADDTDDAITLIISSGFDLKEKGVHTKSELGAKHGKLSGEVLLVAKAVDKAGAYEWQFSSNGISWQYLPGTLEANTKAAGIAPATTAYFRCRPVLKEGVGNWSQTVSIIVT